MRRLLLSVVLVGLLSPASAVASPTALIRDCLQNGRIIGHYPPADYSQALANLPTDVAEYSDCAAVIRRAQLALAAGNSPAAGPANPRQNPLVTATSSERAAVAQAQRVGAAPLDIGGHLVRPGVVAVRTSSIFNALPTPLLVALAALVSIALAALGRSAVAIVRTRRSR